jgi:hypothetical protein
LPVPGVANRFDQLIENWDPVVRRAFLDAVKAMRDAAHLSQIVSMLERGDIEGALRAVGLDPTQLRPLDKALMGAFEAAGNATASLVPVQIVADGFRVVFNFNMRNRDAEDWLAQNSATLISEILDDQRAMIRSYLTNAMAQGVNPRTAALDLVGRVGASGNREGGTIGLTATQEQWVRSYADALASDSPADVLDMALRDARFDASVKRAAANGEPIPADLINKMVTAYRNRALRYRAEAIARTEAMAAMHEAQQQAMEQAAASGKIDRSAISFVWRTARDARVRDSHRAMEGQQRPMGEKFVTGNGNRLEFPGDPNGPASEIVNCRCWREPKVDFLAGIQ